MNDLPEDTIPSNVVLPHWRAPVNDQPVEFKSDTRVKLIAWDLPLGETFFLQWQADPSALEYKLDSHTQQFTVKEP